MLIGPSNTRQEPATMHPSGPTTVTDLGVRRRFLAGVVLLLFACVPIFACERAAPNSSRGPSAARASGTGNTGGTGGPLKIVATTAHMGELVRHAAGALMDAPHASAGPRLELRVLMGEGVDPHGYKLTRSDAVLLDNADLILVSGLRLEGKLAESLAQLRASGKNVLQVGDELPRDRVIIVSDAGATEEGAPKVGTPGEDAAGAAQHLAAAGELEADPHFWMDPELFALAAVRVGGWLADADSKNADAYDSNAAAYAQEIKNLDAYARGVLASVPEQRRVLVTSHDAFGYLSRRFGITVRSVQGLSTESEAGVRDVQDLVELIASRGVPAVFVETSVSPRTIEAVVAGVRAKGKAVIVGGALFSDALGAPGTYEGTYLGMMDHNVTTIAIALGGQAPPRGMAGKLTQKPERVR